MQLSELIDALSQPEAYSEPVKVIEVRQTHISVVLLVDSHVYKIKKPVAPGFLDFTTLEKRRHFCEEEVRLNRRLAPAVYLDVVPIAMTGSGVRLEAEGDVIEWAVKMRRLPEEATLLDRLEHDAVEPKLIASLAQRLAAFHRGAERNSTIAAFGAFEVVARNFLDLFDRTAAQVGRCVPREVFERTRRLAEEKLKQFQPLIKQRASRGLPCDGHGDLHLDHVYVFPEQPPPGDLVIIDCIEFNAQFRGLDPIADMAFVVMDLAFHGRRDLAGAFRETYLRDADDREGRALVPLYTAYRAAVRGMVDGLLQGEGEVPAHEREAARQRSHAHWLLALGELETPEKRPALLLVAGLPGAGKSHLARVLAENSNYELIRSDVVRKELAGLASNQPTPQDRLAGTYSPAMSEATYAECLRRAEARLNEGGRVIVDANFREDRQRLRFLESAIRLGVPAVLLQCVASPAAIRTRLEKRTGDASDANWETYQKLHWENPGPVSQRHLRVISTEDEPDRVLHRVRSVLREAELAD